MKGNIIGILVIMFTLTSYVVSTPLSEAYSSYDTNDATDAVEKVVGAVEKVVGGGGNDDEEDTGGSSGSGGNDEDTGSSSGSSSSESSGSGTGNNTGTSSGGGGSYNDKIPPVAIHNGPYRASEGEEILFDAKASHDSSGIARYEWDFGDGNKAEGAAVKHKFDNDGTYTITLKVVDVVGNEDVETTTAQIKNIIPSLGELKQSIYDVCVTVDGSFSDKGILDTHSATIDWGDGTVSLGKIAEQNGTGTVLGNHAYKNDGKYNVEVKLYDNESFTSKTLSVLVTKQFDYSIGLQSKELVIVKGNAGINKVSIEVPNCSSEEVELNVQGLPQGTSAEFTASKDDTSFASLMVISTTLASTIGEDTVTVTASMDGITKSESFVLKIVEAQAETEDQTSDRQTSNLIAILLSSNEQSGNVPLEVKFQAIAAGGEPPYTWTVDFGDGTEKTLLTQGIKVETSHEYTKQGEYEVHFEVMDSSGTVGKSDSLQIKAANPFDKIQLFTTSVIEEAKLNTEQGSITVLASGPDGTEGSTSLLIPKSVLNLPFTVNINGANTDFELQEESTSNIVTIAYSHSTKLIRVTGKPVQNIILPESDIADAITIVQTSRPMAIGAGSDSNTADADASWILMFVGAGAAGIIYATVVRRKNHTRTGKVLASIEKKNITIEIIPRAITLSAGESVTFYAKAYDSANNEVHDIEFTWSTTVQDAKLIPDGRSAKFTAPGDAETRDTKLFGVRKGEVIVSYGNIAASADVEVREQ